MAKSLPEYFPAYTPASESRASVMKCAKEVSLRVDRERRMVEVRAFFPEIVEKSLLYALEGELAAAHTLNSVRIFPRYPAEKFTKNYMTEVLTETERVGTVSRGFFHYADIEVSESCIRIRVPFGAGGIGILDMARTADVIAGIIKSEFSLDFKVEILSSEDPAYIESVRKNVFEGDFRRLDADIARALAAEQAPPEPNGAPVQPERLPMADTLNSEALDGEQLGDALFKSGFMLFDTRESRQVLGEEFLFAAPTPMRRLQKSTGTHLIMGKVFSVDTRETRRGDKINVSIGITDGDSSIFLRGVYLTEEIEFVSEIKIGRCYAVYGRLRMDTFTNENVMRPQHIAQIAEVLREDRAPQKRVELHLHSVMSQMDAIISPADAIAAAKRFGHPAIAITDHGNVQSFPEMMLAAEKQGGVKVIYGMEAYFVDDTARAVYGDLAGATLEDEFIVFDIETTGLSVANCGITEIGAVKIQGGQVLARYNTFVNPGMPIPQNITELTGITNEMVADAPGIEKAIPDFLDFVGERLLIAHNANFDISFIRAAAREASYTVSQSLYGHGRPFALRESGSEAA